MDNKKIVPFYDGNTPMKECIEWMESEIDFPEKTQKKLRSRYLQSLIHPVKKEDKHDE